MLQQLNRTRTNVWNVQGFSSMDLTVATASPSSHMHSEKKEGQEGPAPVSPNQESSQEPRTDLDRVTWPPLAGKWEEGLGKWCSVSPFTMFTTNTYCFCNKSKIIEILKQVISFLPDCFNTFLPPPPSRRHPGCNNSQQIPIRAAEGVRTLEEIGEQAAPSPAVGQRWAECQRPAKPTCRSFSQPALSPALWGCGYGELINRLAQLLFFYRAGAVVSCFVLSKAPKIKNRPVVHRREWTRRPGFKSCLCHLLLRRQWTSP